MESQNMMENIIPHIYSITNNQNFIKKRMQNNIIKYIYNEVQEAEKEIKKLHKTNQISQKIDYFENGNKKIFPSIFNSHYIVDYIQSYTKEHILGYSKLKVELFNHKIEILFSLLNKGGEDIYVLGNSLIFNMFIWLYIASKHSKSHCAETLKIYCFMTPFKKFLPQNNYNILSPEHCNSAVTTSCQKNGEICIFRKEEFLKVLIHESFHIFGLDFSSLPISTLQKQMRMIFPIQSEMELSESYTEIWATIINSFICANNLSKKNDFTDFIGYLDFCTRMEQIFSLFQLNKILSFMNMDYQNLYEKDDISIAARRYLYKEKTNVFPYYIIKTMFLCNIDKFLEWCKKNNETASNNIFNFNKTFSNLELFGELIKNLYKKKTFIEQIKKIKIIDKKNHPIEFIKTMRMTLCELN